MTKPNDEAPDKLELVAESVDVETAARDMARALNRGPSKPIPYPSDEEMERMVPGITGPKGAAPSARRREEAEVQRLRARDQTTWDAAIHTAAERAEEWELGRQRPMGCRTVGDAIRDLAHAPTPTTSEKMARLDALLKSVEALALEVSQSADATPEEWKHAAHVLEALKLKGGAL